MRQFKVLIALLMKFKFLRDMTPYRLANSFEVIYLPFCMVSYTKHEQLLLKYLETDLNLKNNVESERVQKHRVNCQLCDVCN